MQFDLKYAVCYRFKYCSYARNSNRNISLKRSKIEWDKLQIHGGGALYSGENTEIIFLYSRRNVNFQLRKLPLSIPELISGPLFE